MAVWVVEVAAWVVEAPGWSTAEPVDSACVPIAVPVGCCPATWGRRRGFRALQPLVDVEVEIALALLKLVDRVRLHLQLTAQVPDLDRHGLHFLEQLDQSLRAEQPLEPLEPLVEVTRVDDGRLRECAGGMYEACRKSNQRCRPQRIHSRTR